MWTNWARNVRCTPAALERPRSVEDVAAAVLRGERVRVAGSGHSFTPLAATDGTLISLERMGAVLDADPASGLVRVQAGITLRALSAELHARGLAMANLGDIDAQTLAGALATGTHGTGARLPNLAGQVEAMELVLADGSVRELAGGDELRAARIGLGALGVVTAVTLRCVPAFRLHAVDRPEPLEAVLEALEGRSQVDHFEFWTFPHSRVAITRTNVRTDRPLAGPGRARAWLDDVLLENHAFGAINRLGRRRPALIPRLNRLMGRVASRRERVGQSFDVFASRRLVRFIEMEHAIPAARAAEAVVAVREILERHPVSFPIELRFGAADDALLSPAHRRASAFLSVHVFEGLPWEPAFREVEALMSGWGGRPHWGKWTFLEAGELARRYPRWEAFAAVRARLDPGGRFENDWTRRVLGPVSPASGTRPAPARSPAPPR